MNKGYIPEGEVATNYSDSSSLNELSSLTKISIHPFENAPFFIYYSLNCILQTHVYEVITHIPKLSLRREKIPQRRLTFAETKENNQEHPPIQHEDTISEEDFQSAQGESLPTDVLPAHISPVAPRAEIILHTGLADQNVPYKERNITNLTSISFFFIGILNRKYKNRMTK